MKVFKKILYPVIFSKSSDTIVPFVHIIAKQFNSQIHLLFVVKVFEHLSISQPDKEILAEANRRLLEFKNKHFNPFPDTVISVVAGDTWEEIIYYIHANSIDLLIMGTHGRRGLDKIIFGSVAERVIKTAPIPVLVVNPYRLINHSFFADEKSEVAETISHRQLQN
jgi:nucleotide-binding universal stress UspA family protein